MTLCNLCNCRLLIAMNYKFITKTMLYSIYKLLRLLKMRVAVFKCLRHFIKKKFTLTSLLLRPVSYVFLTSLKLSFRYLTFF